MPWALILMKDFLHTTKKRNNQLCLGSGINQAQNYFFAKENTSSISWDRLDVWFAGTRRKQKLSMFRLR